MTTVAVASSALKYWYDDKTGRQSRQLVMLMQLQLVVMVAVFILARTVTMMMTIMMMVVMMRILPGAAMICDDGSGIVIAT